MKKEPSGYPKEITVEFLLKRLDEWKKCLNESFHTRTTMNVIRNFMGDIEQILNVSGYTKKKGKKDVKKE